MICSAVKLLRGERLLVGAERLCVHSLSEAQRQAAQKMDHALFGE